MCLSVTNDIQEQVNSARRTVRRVAFAAFWQRRCSGELQNFSNSDNRHTHGKIDTEPLHEATRSPPNHPVHKARNLLHPRGAGGTFDGFLALGDSSEVRNFGYINNNEKFSSLQHRGGRVVYGAGFKRSWHQDQNTSGAIRARSNRVHGTISFFFEPADLVKRVRPAQAFLLV